MRWTGNKSVLTAIGATLLIPFLLMVAIAIPILTGDYFEGKRLFLFQER